ncbi:anti-sigma factor [Ferrimicrobium sp.]|uniref:anti-sigma factor family protein n=1 Tax=Ferrimicrobium sp. TaxID=2926050 RepID=UPI002614E8FE|nr:zf-HC2 domain-containing protein [Ferrimicrobium sp.]
MSKPWKMIAERRYCFATMRVLQDYLDGALDDARADQVARHLDDCRRCGLEAEVYQEIKTALSKQEMLLDPQTVQRLRNFSDQLIREGASSQDESHD